MVEYGDTSLMHNPLLAPYWKFYDSDSALTKVTFTAALDNAIYEWHIGAGIYTTKSFTLDFTGIPRPSVIPVTLIVNKQHNQKCFPGGKDADTTTRNLNIIYAPDSIYFTGIYQGTFANDPSTQVSYSIIRIPSSFGYKYYIANFFSAGDTINIGFYNDLTDITQRYFAFGNATGSIEYSVINYFNPANKQVTGTFEINNLPAANNSIRIFNGQKIQ
jgi:hypothetical protein